MKETLITAKNLSHSIRNKTLLDDASLVLHRQTCVALVGQNGAGKSTLMKILQGQIQPDNGDISYKKDLVMAELSQTVPDAAQLSCLQALELDNQEGDFLAQQNILKSLGLGPEQPFSELSGGQKRRLLLAKAMQQQPDVLFLDEPTNHLDIPTINQMVAQLKRFRGTCFFVSHDRWFIEQLADHIVDLDFGQLIVYPGSFKHYLEAKEQAYEAMALEQSLRKAKLKQEERWLQRGVTGRRKRNQGRLAKLKDLREQYRTYQQPKKNLKLAKQQLQQSGKKVLELKELSFAYQDKVIFENFSQTIFRGEKIGIIGGNGVGKTTLIRCLIGTLTPTAGQVQLGSKIELAYFDQHRQQLDANMSVFDNIAEGRTHVEVAGKSIHVMSYLQRFLFTGAQAQGSIDRLSGGEKNRLMLAKCLAKPANVLILDEPTNDLDIATLEILEDFLVDYPGTVFVISHDQMFLDHIITSAWLLTGAQHIEVCDGQLSAWQDKVSNKPKKQKKQTTATAPAEAPKKNATKLSYHQVRRLQELPKLIEQTEQQLAELYQASQEPKFYQQATETIKAHQQQISHLEQQLNELFTEWEELESHS